MGLRASKLTTNGGIALWGALAIGGTLALSAYSNRAGSSAHAAEVWPPETSIEPIPARPNLLFFLHPRCPCSRASVSELSRIIGRIGDAVALTVILYLPEEASAEDWEGDLGARVRKIPGARVLEDRDGLEAKKFGITTSGHALLFSERGTRIFSGGVTAGRGHEGENRGQRAIEAWVLSGEGSSSHRDSPTFGCAIEELEATPATRDGEVAE